MKLLYAVLLSLVLVGGCAASKSGMIQSRQELEQTIKAQLQNEFKAKGIDATVKEVSLVESGSNSYDGFATASDNSQTKLHVTIGADGKAIFTTAPLN